MAHLQLSDDLAEQLHGLFGVFQLGQGHQFQSFGFQRFGRSRNRAVEHFDRFPVALFPVEDMTPLLIHPHRPFGNGVDLVHINLRLVERAGLAVDVRIGQIEVVLRGNLRGFRSRF